MPNAPIFFSIPGYGPLPIWINKSTAHDIANPTVGLICFRQEDIAHELLDGNLQLKSDDKSKEIIGNISALQASGFKIVLIAQEGLNATLGILKALNEDIKIDLTIQGYNFGIREYAERQFKSNPNTIFIFTEAMESGRKYGYLDSEQALFQKFFSQEGKKEISYLLAAMIHFGINPLDEANRGKVTLFDSSPDLMQEATSHNMFDLQKVNGPALDQRVTSSKVGGGHDVMNAGYIGKNFQDTIVAQCRYLLEKAIFATPSSFSPVTTTPIRNVATAQDDIERLQNYLFQNNEDLYTARSGSLIIANTPEELRITSLLNSREILTIYNKSSRRFSSQSLNGMALDTKENTAAIIANVKTIIADNLGIETNVLEDHLLQQRPRGAAGRS